MTVDEIVNVIAVRNWFVTAPGAMNMSWIMFSAVMIRRTLGGIRRANRNLMLFDYAVITHPVQMSVVQVIGVILMLNTDMSASGTMNVLVIIVGMFGHKTSI